MEYKNKCKFGLYIKDIDKVIEPNGKFECNNSGNISILIKEHKIEKIEHSESNTVIELDLQKQDDIHEEIKPKKKGNKNKNRYIKSEEKTEYDGYTINPLED